MELTDIRTRFEAAIENLYQSDGYLIQANLHERSVTHKLAVCLQQQFPLSDVDHEYNGNIENDRNHKKEILILNTEFKCFFAGIRKPEIIGENAVLSVFPNIIVHRRRTNTENKLIVEVKTAGHLTSNKHDRFDIRKVKAYTKIDNGLGYQLGVFIQFCPDKYRAYYFIDGEEIADWRTEVSVMP